LIEDLYRERKEVNTINDLGDVDRREWWSIQAEMLEQWDDERNKRTRETLGDWEPSMLKEVRQRIALSQRGRDD
jgi:hypothetical protein